MKNKGFSLVELIVAMAILSIVGTAVIGFCLAGTNSYKTVSADVDLQYEAQLSLNQLEDLIIDATRGVVYEYSYTVEDEENPGTTKIVSSMILNDSKITTPGDDTVSKTLSIYSDSEAYKIIWKIADQEVWLEKYPVTLDTSTGKTVYTVAATPGSNNLMAENVSDFSVSLSGVDKKNEVIVKATFLKAERSFHTTKKITLRNNLIANGDLDEFYPEEGIVKAVVTGIEIFLDGSKVTTHIMKKGLAEADAPVFTTFVIGNNMPSQDVVWSFEGAHHDGTTIENGKLIVSPDETAASLRIVATTKATDADNNPRSAFVDITFKEVTGITVAKGDGEESRTLYPRDTLSPTAKVIGTNIGDEEYKNVIWKWFPSDNLGNIYPGASETTLTNVFNETSKSNKTSLVIPEDIITSYAPENADKAYLTIVATTVGTNNAEISAKTTYTVNRENYSITISSSSANLSRGGSVTLTANTTPASLDGNRIKWEITKVVEVQPALHHDAVKGDEWIKYSDNPDYQGYIWATAYLNWKGKWEYSYFADNPRKLDPNSDFYKWYKTYTPAYDDPATESVITSTALGNGAFTISGSNGLQITLSQPSGRGHLVSTNTYKVVVTASIEGTDSKASVELTVGTASCGLTIDDEGVPTNEMTIHMANDDGKYYIKYDVQNAENSSIDWSVSNKDVAKVESKKIDNKKVIKIKAKGDNTSQFDVFGKINGITVATIHVFPHRPSIGAGDNKYYFSNFDAINDGARNEIKSGRYDYLHTYEVKYNGIVEYKYHGKKEYVDQNVWEFKKDNSDAGNAQANKISNDWYGTGI